MGSAFTTLVGNPPVCTALSFRDWLLSLRAARLAEIPLTRSATYYFSQGGNDSTGDGSIGNPYKTIAKAQAVHDAWAQSAGGLALLFQRGGVWRESAAGLALTKSYVTVADYGTGPKPILSRFQTPYDNSWTLTAGKTYTYERAETNTVAWVREIQDNDNPYLKCQSIAEVEANERGWFWDSGAHKIYAHVPGGGGPIDFFQVEAVYDNAQAGISIAGDFCRIQNLEVVGFGCRAAAGNNDGNYGIHFVPGTSNTACLIVACDCTYNEAHSIGMTSNAGPTGNVLTCIGCRGGWMSGQTTSGTTFIGYSNSGGHEATFWDCESIGGNLPSTAVDPAIAETGGGVYGHSGGTAALFVAMGCTNRPRQWQVSAPTHFDNAPSFADLKDCRQFVVDEQFVMRLPTVRDGTYTVAIPAGYPMLTNGVRVNNKIQMGWFAQTSPPASDTYLIPNNGHGIWINCAFELRRTFGTSRCSAALGYGSGNGDDWRAYNCLLLFQSIAPGEFGLTQQAIFGAASTTSPKFVNSVLAAETGSRQWNRYVGLQPALNNAANQTQLLNNAYCGADYSKRSDAILGWSTDPYGVESYDNYRVALASGSLPSGHQQLIEGQYPLQYDARWRPRDSTTPAIGPLEPVAADADAATLAGVNTLLSRLGVPAAATVSADVAAVKADTVGTATLLSRIPGTVQPQTGDSYARLGNPSGASLAADLAAVKTDTAGLAAVKPAHAPAVDAAGAVTTNNPAIVRNVTVTPS